MASDNFTNSDGTQLATHDPYWTSVDGDYSVANLEINNNLCESIGAWQEGGAFYAGSSEEASQVVMKGIPGGCLVQPACRMGTNQRGYAAQLGNSSGGNFTAVYIRKDGVWLSTLVTGASIPHADDHTLKVSVSGTTTVTIEVFLDGVSQGTVTDSSSPIGPGSPGFFLEASTSVEQTRLDNWTDGVSTDLPIGLTSLVHSHTLNSVVLTHKNTLSSANMTHAMDLGEPILSVASILIVQWLNQAHTLEKLGLTQKNTISVDGLSQVQSATQADPVQKHLIAMANLSHSQGMPVPNLVQKNTLSIADLAQAHALGGVTLELAGLLSIANLMHSHGIDNIDVVHAHNIAVDNLDHAQDIGSVDLALALLLEVAGLSQAHSLDAMELSLVNVLAVDNIGHSHHLGVMSLTQAQELLINDLQHSQNLSSVSFITTKGRVTITMSMKVPGISFEMETPNINFEME